MVYKLITLLIRYINNKALRFITKNNPLNSVHIMCIPYLRKDHKYMFFTPDFCIDLSAVRRWYWVERADMLEV